MQTKSRKEIFEEKLEKYKGVQAIIEEHKKNGDRDRAAMLEGQYMFFQMHDLRDFLGDRISETKLFTIGPDQMSKDELESDYASVKLIMKQLKQRNEFSEDIYEMLEDGCSDIYGFLGSERELTDEENKIILYMSYDYESPAMDILSSIRSQTLKALTKSMPKSNIDKLRLISIRRSNRKQLEKEMPKKQQEKELEEKPEVDASDRNMLRKYETGRRGFGRC